MNGYDRWLDPPDDPPDGEYCPKHRRHNCQRCEQEIDDYLDRKRDTYFDGSYTDQRGCQT